MINRGKNPVLAGFILLLFVPLACSAAGAANISVNASSARQTMEAIGGNYCFDKSNTALGTHTLNNLKPRNVRVEMDLNQWEPVNDNGDPNNFFWSNFKDTGATHTNFVQMQDFMNRGIPIVAAIWDVPNWMVSNPAATRQRVIPSSMYDEAVESIAAYLIYARDHYGVTIPLISFNEANGGYQTLFSPTEMRVFIKKSGARFASLGLPTKWVVGDVSNPSAAVSYITPILQDTSITQYLGPVSVHSWNAESVSDATFSGIATLAGQYGKNVWVLEVGLDPAGWEIDGYTSTWSYGFTLARLYYRLIGNMRATVLDYWEYGTDYELMDRSTLAPYPAYYVVKQLSDLLLPGTQILETSSSSSSVLVLSGIHRTTGRFMVQMINTGTSAESAYLTGLPNTALTMQRIGDGESMVIVGTYTPSGGALTVSLRAQSVTTLSGTDSAASQTKVPAPPSGLSIR